jgi:hypothetical protein
MHEPILNHTIETVPCRWCGSETPRLASRICRDCNELEIRIAAEPALVWSMLQATGWWQQQTELSLVQLPAGPVELPSLEPVVPPIEPPKRKRGRPPGSRNKNPARRNYGR